MAETAEGGGEVADEVVHAGEGGEAGVCADGLGKTEGGGGGEGVEEGAAVGGVGEKVGVGAEEVPDGGPGKADVWVQ